MAAGFYGERQRWMLPHPAIALSLHLIVEEAVRVAWQILRNRENFDLQTAGEKAITRELHEVITDEVFALGVVAGFDGQVFVEPIREPHIRNFNGEHPDKEPDLVFKLIDRAGVRKSQDGIFVECKPVDSDHGVARVYCDKGIARFVKGDYAWAMLSASMFGYVEQETKIIPQLNQALQKRQDLLPTIGLPAQCEVSKADPNSEPVHITQHKREFHYVEDGNQAPPIALRHLWLVRD